MKKIFLILILFLFFLPLAGNAYYYLDWTASDTASIFDYAGNLFSDLQPFLLIIVGIGVGLLIFEAIMGAIHRK
ncbi:MAG: hypothetical protein IMZ52_10650 [Actinobacteria bacterium]|nr:hypothetical protein [Actinomycetota bacterium]